MVSKKADSFLHRRPYIGGKYPPFSMNWFRQPRMWGKNNIESVKMIDLIVYLRVSNTLFITDSSERKYTHLCFYDK